MRIITPFFKNEMKRLCIKYYRCEEPDYGSVIIILIVITIIIRIVINMIIISGMYTVFWLYAESPSSLYLVICLYLVISLYNVINIIIISGMYKLFWLYVESPSSLSLRFSTKDEMLKGNSVNHKKTTEIRQENFCNSTSKSADRCNTSEQLQIESTGENIREATRLLNQGCVKQNAHTHTHTDTHSFSIYSKDCLLLADKITFSHPA